MFISFYGTPFIMMTNRWLNVGFFYMLPVLLCEPSPGTFLSLCVYVCLYACPSFCILFSFKAFFSFCPCLLIYDQWRTDSTHPTVTSPDPMFCTPMCASLVLSHGDVCHPAHCWFFQSPDTQAWQNDYLQGTGCEMYTETLSPSFTGMTFPQASE